MIQASPILTNNAIFHLTTHFEIGQKWNEGVNFGWNHRWTTSLTCRGEEEEAWDLLRSATRKPLLPVTSFRGPLNRAVTLHRHAMINCKYLIRMCVRTCTCVRACVRVSWTRNICSSHGDLDTSNVVFRLCTHTFTQLSMHPLACTRIAGFRLVMKDPHAGSHGQTAVTLVSWHTHTLACNKNNNNNTHTQTYTCLQWSESEKEFVSHAAQQRMG